MEGQSHKMENLTRRPKLARDKPEFEKKTIRLFVGDADAMNRFYPEAGYNRAIRTLVRQHLRSLEERLSRRLSSESLGEDEK